MHDSTTGVHINSLRLVVSWYVVCQNLAQTCINPV